MFNLLVRCSILICLLLNVGFVSPFVVSGGKGQETRRLISTKSKSSNLGTHPKHVIPPPSTGVPSEKRKHVHRRSRIKTESSKHGVRQIVQSGNDKTSSKKSAVGHTLKHHGVKHKHLSESQKKSNILKDQKHKTLEVQKTVNPISRTEHYGGEHGGEHKCSIPFIYDGKTIYSCIGSAGNASKKWCSLTNNYDRDTRWMYCPTDTKRITTPRYQKPPGNTRGNNSVDARELLSDFTNEIVNRLPNAVNFTHTRESVPDFWNDVNDSGQRLPNTVNFTNEVVYTIGGNKTFDDLRDNDVETQTPIRNSINDENSTDIGSADEADTTSSNREDVSPIKIQYNGGSNEDEITAFVHKQFNKNPRTNINDSNTHEDSLYNPQEKSEFEHRNATEGDMENVSEEKGQLDDDDKAMIDFVSNKIMQSVKNTTNVSNRTNQRIKNGSNLSQTSRKDNSALKYKKLSSGKKPYIIFHNEQGKGNTSETKKKQQKQPGGKNVNIIIINNGNDTPDPSDIESTLSETMVSLKKQKNKQKSDASVDDGHRPKENTFVSVKGGKTSKSKSKGVSNKSSDANDIEGEKPPIPMQITNNKVNTQYDENDVLGNSSTIDYKSTKDADNTEVLTDNNNSEMGLTDGDINAITSLSPQSADENNAAVDDGGVNRKDENNPVQSEKSINASTTMNNNTAQIDNAMNSKPSKWRFKWSPKNVSIVSNNNNEYNQSVNQNVNSKSDMSRNITSSLKGDKENDASHTGRILNISGIYFDENGSPVQPENADTDDTALKAQNANETTTVRFDNEMNHKIKHRIKNVLLNKINSKDKNANKTSNTNKTNSNANEMANVSRVQQEKSTSLLQSLPPSKVKNSSGIKPETTSQDRNTSKSSNQGSNNTLVVDVHVSKSGKPASPKLLKNTTNAIEEAMDTINKNNTVDSKLLIKNNTKETAESSVVHINGTKIKIKTEREKPSNGTGNKHYTYSDLLNDYNEDETGTPTVLSSKTSGHSNVSLQSSKTSGRVNMSSAPNEFETLTFGGNANGGKCNFPFIYDGATYYTCITKTRGKPWCSTTANYDKLPKWGFCNNKDLSGTNMGNVSHGLSEVQRKSDSKRVDSGDIVHDEGTELLPAPSNIQTFGGTANGRNCAFPFVYDGEIYSRCIPRNGGPAWCAVSHSYDVSPLWGYCSKKTLH